VIDVISDLHFSSSVLQIPNGLKVGLFGRFEAWDFFRFWGFTCHTLPIDLTTPAKTLEPNKFEVAQNPDSWMGLRAQPSSVLSLTLREFDKRDSTHPKLRWRRNRGKYSVENLLRHIEKVSTETLQAQRL